MPDDRVQQVWYRHGPLRERVSLRAGRPQGLARSWHPNGRLASEQRYHNGRLHGRCRQWDEHGRLLGEFTMEHGTGVQREWHDNGQLKLETPMIGGQFCGRSRLWLRTGELLSEHYFLRGKQVTRSAYQRTAMTDPSLPQYDSEPDRPATFIRPSARTIHQAFVAELQARPIKAEAREWLANAKHPSLGRFATSKLALVFVESLHHSGALKVIVPGIYRDKRGNEYADWLLVELPKGKVARAKIRQVCGQIRRRRLGSFEPQRGLGETHIVISMV